MSRRTKLAPTLKPVLLPKTLLRAGNAGVIADAFTGNQSTVRTAQEGFAKGIWQRMTVYGVDAAGRARDKVEFAVKSGSKSGDELVAISGDDNTDYLTRTDRGMAEAVVRSKQRFDRKGLTPRVQFGFADDIAADPERRARHEAELGTSSAPPPPVADGHSLEPKLSVHPERDPDQSFSIFWGKRR